MLGLLIQFFEFEVLFLIIYFILKQKYPEIAKKILFIPDYKKKKDMS